MQAKYIILDNTYNNSFLLDETYISNKEEYKCHDEIFFIVNTQIEKYELEKPEKEIYKNIKENIDQHKINEVQIELKFYDDNACYAYYKKKSLSKPAKLVNYGYYTKESLSELVKLVNRFNNMKEDEHIICDFRPEIEDYEEESNIDYIYMTNYGKIFLVENMNFKLYELNWKIPEKYIRYIYYYHSLYNKSKDYMYLDNLLSSIYNLYRLYREEMIEEILENYLAKNLSKVVISYV
jgi:hypothetical protein